MSGILVYVVIENYHGERRVHTVTDNLELAKWIVTTINTSDDKRRSAVIQPHTLAEIQEEVTDLPSPVADAAIVSTVIEELTNVPDPETTLELFDKVQKHSRTRLGKRALEQWRGTLPPFPPEQSVIQADMERCQTIVECKQVLNQYRVKAEVYGVGIDDVLLGVIDDMSPSLEQRVWQEFATTLQ